MKILRLFIKDANTTYEFPDTIMESFEQIYTTEDRVVTFRGEIYEWITYDKVQDKNYEVEMKYGLLKPSSLWVNPHPSATVGPKDPVKIECECGAEKCGHPGHSDWCDILHKDGWDEAVRQYIEAAEYLDSMSDNMYSFNIRTDHTPVKISYHMPFISHNPPLSTIPIYSATNYPAHVSTCGCANCYTKALTKGIP